MSPQGVSESLKPHDHQIEPPPLIEATPWCALLDEWEDILNCSALDVCYEGIRVPMYTYLSMLLLPERLHLHVAVSFFNFWRSGRPSPRAMIAHILSNITLPQNLLLAGLNHDQKDVG
jgi:hypothetical protein